VIFSGAISALALMTALSTALGVVLPALLPHYVTHVLSIVFFASFGLKMLREWYYMDPDEGQEELEETEGELKDLALEVAFKRENRCVLLSKVPSRSPRCPRTSKPARGRLSAITSRLCKA